MPTKQALERAEEREVPGVTACRRCNGDNGRTPRSSIRTPRKSSRGLWCEKISAVCFVLYPRSPLPGFPQLHMGGGSEEQLGGSALAMTTANDAQ